MKASFPLSLKVAVWLLLNLLLLGAAALTFVVAQGGLSWDSLVAGVSGEHLHAFAAVISGEVAAATDDGRNAVLDRFGRAYHAEFLLVRNHGPQVAGPVLPIPEAVRRRIDEGPMRPPGADPFLGGDDAAPGADALAGGAAIAARRPNPRGRFLVHTKAPSAWWIGLRVPFPGSFSLPAPATLIIRTHSFWGVVWLLNLETWFLIAASVLVLSVLFWLPLVRSVTRHLRDLSLATERIADGRFETRVPTNRRDELGRLGESVNAMAARLDALVNGQKRFLADVAHELGSPIARLQVATGILEDQADAALQAQVADVREEVQQMAELVNELLAFTKAGLRDRHAALAFILLEPLIAQVLDREDTGHRVQCSVTPALRVVADEPLLMRALANLIRNALRHAGDSATIALTARGENGSVIVCVEDDGPGVPAAALERLGEPFFRPEFARTRDTGGIGLGLAIVRSAVGACNAHVQFSNRTPHGFRAEIRLTAAAS